VTKNHASDETKGKSGVFSLNEKGKNMKGGENGWESLFD
jgi:hypothetical protein